MPAFCPAQPLVCGCRQPEDKTEAHEDPHCCFRDAARRCRVWAVRISKTETRTFVLCESQSTLVGCVLSLPADGKNEAWRV